MKLIHGVVAEVMVGPGLSSEPAYLSEVQAAIAKSGLDPADVKEVDEGKFLIPVTEEQIKALQDGKTNGFSLEIPEEARDSAVPKPEFASHVWFHLEEER